MKKILITGGGGYIGSMLATKLIMQGYKVTVLDLMKYDESSLDHLYYHDNFHFFKVDVTKKNILKKHILKNDVIIPLAALVGAPLCEKYKKKAVDTNFKQIKNILSLIKPKQHLIYMNSNSGYGIGEKNKFCDENSPLNPISLYGKTKVDAENLVKKFKNQVTFRLATVFGYSYRMRTDLLVNNFVFKAVKGERLDIYEPNFRRNFVHVRDVCDAIIYSVKNFNKLKGEVYNLGLSSANITKIKLVKKVKKAYPKTKYKIIEGIKDIDQRDYFVSNKKIEKKGFKAKVKLETGIFEVLQVFLNSKKNYKNNY